MRSHNYLTCSLCVSYHFAQLLAKSLGLAMYFTELAILLASCYNIAQAFSPHGYHYGITNVYRKINEIEKELPDCFCIDEKWIRQPLDNFDKAEKRSWHMRFFQRLDLWKPNGPIFLFINGEHKAEKVFLQTGIMYDLAKETNGAMFLSEHRYYGGSKPFNQFTTENLKYLSSSQALADNARLLRSIKSIPQFSSSKVVVVGGSYAGNLAAWMKLKYPDLVDAAISVSAPVLAKADFFEYLETVGIDFKKYGTPGCFEQIRKIFKRYDDLFKTAHGRQVLKQEEHICDGIDMNNLGNQHVFFFYKANVIMNKIQNGDLSTIKNFCQNIQTSSQIILSINDTLDMSSKLLGCFDITFGNMIRGIKTHEEYMAWTYQTCTEFGYYTTTNSKNNLLTHNIPIMFYYHLCTAIYGQEFGKKRVEDGVIATNKMYGGLLPDVKNVVFVNGELDPWHRLSIIHDLSSKAPAIFVPFTSHCTALLSDLPGDPQELKAARRYIKHLIKTWIGA